MKFYSALITLALASFSVASPAPAINIERRLESGILPSLVCLNSTTAQLPLVGSVIDGLQLVTCSSAEYCEVLSSGGLTGGLGGLTGGLSGILPLSGAIPLGLGVSSCYNEFVRDIRSQLMELVDLPASLIRFTGCALDMFRLHFPQSSNLLHG